MSNWTFLTEDEYWGDNQLDVFKKRGTKAAITDFAILLGGWVSSTEHVDTDEHLSGRTGYYWTKSDDGDNDARAVSFSGNRLLLKVLKRYCGARPALPYSSIDNIFANVVSIVKAKDGITEIRCGGIPQQAPLKNMQIKLEKAYKRGGLKRVATGPITDSRKYNEYNEPFLPFEHEQYEYEGKRYVRVKANSCFNGAEFTLSNGERYKDGDYVWVEVQPFTFWLDEKKKWWIPEKIYIAGIQFNEKSNYHTEDFDKTNIKRYLDEHWAKYVELSMEEVSLGDKTEEPKNLDLRKSRLQKLNPDKTKQTDRVKMTDTEIIHDWIEAGASVLLRGPSGIGKTERIKSLYPDLIYMKLTNNMFPEKVVGSVNLQTGQSIPPDFAKTAIMQGANEEEKKLIEENIQNIFKIADTVYERSKESEKKVVILLDELLNVKPAIQSLVYTLVLNRIVEIGNGLKLPDNVVVVATGNQKKYSNVAEDLAEPLQKRFDHILDMEPRVGEWITEYAIPQKVHPTVIGYMLSKYNSSNKSEDIDDIGYFYEEPEVGEEHLDKYGCEGRTNDPRGWTSISNTLYKFEKNLQSGKYEGKDVEDILKRSIGSKLRMEWAEEFFDYYNLPTLTPEEVVQGMGKGYTQADLPRDINERFAYMTALITADESQVEACREFVRKNCDPEYLAIYDIYWAGNDERKMEKISELQEMDLNLHSKEEVREYAEKGASAYKSIGQEFSRFLGRNSKEKVGGEEHDRTQV